MKNYAFEIIDYTGRGVWYIVKGVNPEDAYIKAEEHFPGLCEIIFDEEVDDLELENELWDGYIIE